MRASTLGKHVSLTSEVDGIGEPLVFEHLCNNSLNGVSVMILVGAW